MKRYILVAVGLVVGASLLGADIGADIIGDQDIATTQLARGRYGYFDSDSDDDSYHDGRGFERHFERALERAGASEKQIMEIEELVESNRSLQRERHNQLEELERQIRDELRRDNSNRATLENLIRQAGEIRTQLTIDGVNTRLRIQEILGSKIWGDLNIEDRDNHRRRGRRRR